MSFGLLQTIKEYFSPKIEVPEDPDYNVRASRLKDIYKGYPHIHVMDNPPNDLFHIYGDWLQILTEMRLWCQKNCKEKTRIDVKRLYQQSYQWDDTYEWFENEFGGDYVVIAFKNEQDRLWFILRWC